MKQLDHIRITAEAIRRFIRYSQSPAALMLLQHSRLVQQGAEDADISPLYTRVTNWHFYNRNLDQDVLQEPVWSFMEPLTFHLSSDRILRKRCEQLKEEAAKGSLRDCCDLTGRILHHIQDMSTPSHVIPVFHGPLIPDSFENYLCDAYLADEGRLAKIMPNQAVEQAMCTPQPHIPVLQVYQDAAEKTLTLLNSEEANFPAMVNGRPRDLSWSYFWADKNTSHTGAYPSECKFGGFGNFGPLGKHFGTTTVIHAGDDTYLIQQQVYDGLCRQLVEEMLVNSIKTLFLLESDLKKLC
jgi:hypothetical protein